MQKLHAVLLDYYDINCSITIVIKCTSSFIFDQVKMSL